MSDEYDISSESDLDDLADNLVRAQKKMAEDAVSQKSHEAECPFCKKKAKFHSGKNVCPHCGKTVDVTLKVDWLEGTS